MPIPVSRRIPVISLAATLVSQASAYADSDGYFCVGEGYVAYEMAFSVPVNGHTLRIMTPDEEQVATRRDISLSDFQVHGMACLEDAVLLRDFSGVFIVDLATGEVTRAKAKSSPELAKPARSLVDGRSLRRGDEVHVEIISLPGWSEDAVDELHIISYEAHPHSASIQHHTVSQIVRTHAHGFVDTQLIYAGAQLETVD